VELDRVRDYLAIEEARFGKRLTWDVRGEDDALAVDVPPMLVQPLVENAVLHGIGSKKEGGRVEVEALREGEGARITVKDNGVGPGGWRRRGSGTGLWGVRERLALACGPRARVEVGHAPGGGFAATIVLPGGPL